MVEAQSLHESGTNDNNNGNLMERLPIELLYIMSSFLTVPDLVRLGSVNLRFRVFAYSDPAGWPAHFNRLKREKLHITHQESEPSYFLAYQRSFVDATTRSHVLKEELCYDDSCHQGTIWSFRFKKSAGPDWTSADPWWNGEVARKMVFLQDGSVKQYVRPDVVSDDGFTNSVLLQDPPISMKWRFLQRPMDLPLRPEGGYIRFTVGGRDVPTYVVRRSPTGNWGFLLESCWGIYTSFDLPLKRDTENEMEVEELASVDKELLLTDDSALSITNEVQWREALLYNFGARVLPEGDDALEWNQSPGVSLDARG